MRRGQKHQGPVPRCRPAGQKLRGSADTKPGRAGAEPTTTPVSGDLARQTAEHRSEIQPLQSDNEQSQNIRDHRQPLVLAAAEAQTGFLCRPQQRRTPRRTRARIQGIAGAPDDYQPATAPGADDARQFR